LDKQIKWTGKAIEDVRNIYEAYSSHWPPYAADFLNLLDNRISRLSRFPHSGPPIAGMRGYRHLPLFNYRLFYRIDGDTILIMGVLHGATNFKQELRKRGK
jgi:addiction module RelE/StbE family toxin